MRSGRAVSLIAVPRQPRDERRGLDGGLLAFGADRRRCCGGAGARSPSFAAIAAVAFVQWLLDEPRSPTLALLVGALQRRGATSSGADRRWPRSRPRGRHPARGAALGRRARCWPRFLGALGLATAAAVLGTTPATAARYSRRCRSARARLERERDQQAQLATAAERARIAREMHDVVAHNVSVMIALADGAAATPSSTSPSAPSARCGRRRAPAARR